ncbi:glycosyltransferase family 2 protein [Vacuolonema iberomarrocanum]|uniref:glycosyltransferase family 2 protein n=1 Tax=Vacuolonema iberomarrocanum TaxID=3454632 RepID=UPI0019D82C39|nr:glycosyltransferase family 2 protein [filamentous cyanobacterium LEGE 07170]
MKIAVCITTMNRPNELALCLNALWNSTTTPYKVIISDNSMEPEIQQKNKTVVQHYSDTLYLRGTYRGVSSNRNNALSAVPSDADWVIFIADDICVDPHMFERAINHYYDLPKEERDKTIITGDNRNEFSPPDIGPLGVNFKGYFCPWKPGLPQVVNLYATLFPRAFLDQEQWDENIFLGQEDIELSLRAIRCGYTIAYYTDLKVTDICFNKSTMGSTAKGTLTSYEIYVAASRLYIGIKRYKHLFPNALKLLMFTVTYYTHMALYLFRRRSLSSLADIIKVSNINAL